MPHPQPAPGRISRGARALALGLAFAGAAALAVPGAAAEPRVLKDQRYAEDSDPRHGLDLYVPEAQPGGAPTPVLLFLYGGGLTAGRKGDHAALGAFFAAHGWLTAVADYRLSPAVSHPAHVRDAAAAFDWLADHAAEHGGDPARIAVMGHSAGGYLAALLALDPRYLEARGRSPREIAAVVPISGFFHVERVAPSRSPSIWGEERREWRQASPSAYVAPTAPPMLLLYADGDEADRRKESVDLADALRARGDRKVEVSRIDGRNHSTILSEMGREGEPATDQVLAYLARMTGAAAAAQPAAGH